MKKFFKMIVLCSVICAMFVLSMSAFATEEQLISVSDSMHISPEVLSALNALETDKILKVFNIPFVYAMQDADTITGIMNSSHLQQTLYAVTSTDGQTKIFDVSSQYVVTQLIDTAIDVSEAHTGTAIKRVDEDIEISSLYYLWGESNYQGVAILYETNLGDFVYYRFSGEYLMPFDEFVLLMDSIYAEMGPSVPPGGYIDPASIYDLKRFDLNSESFAPHSNASNVDINQNDNKPDNNGVVNQGVTNNSNGGSQSIETQNSTNMFWWIGVPCIIVLLIVGMIFGVKRRKG